MGLITGATDYEGFGDVDFVIEAVPERMEIKQQVFAELDADHAGPRDPGQQHLIAVDQRDGQRHRRPEKVVGFHFFYPGLGDAADRGRRG